MNQNKKIVWVTVVNKGLHGWFEIILPLSITHTYHINYQKINYMPNQLHKNFEIKTVVRHIKSDLLFYMLLNTYLLVCLSIHWFFYSKKLILMLDFLWCVCENTGTY